jgi:hypothetical protein
VPGKRSQLAWAGFILAAALIASSIGTQETAAATRSVHPARQHGRSLVFKLKRIDPTTIRAAYLKVGARTHELSVSRVRAGARRGVLRVRMPRGASRHTQRHAARSTAAGPTLVLVTSQATTTSVDSASGTTTTTAATMAPVADAYVTASRKNRNFGAATELRADASPVTRSYLHFNIQGLTGPPSRALLKLHAAGSSSVGLDARPVADSSWSESGITYSNAPAAGAVAASAAGFSSGDWVSMDVTSLVKGNGALSLALTTPSSSEIKLSSRETANDAPQLSLETTTTSPTASTVDPVASSPPPAPHYTIRGVYDRDASATGFDLESAIGFNFIDSSPNKDQMDQLAARGLKGFAWLGGYSNTTCTFNQSDDWVRSHVAAVAGNPGVGAYFIDDEPDPVSCPNVADQIKARSDLVKSIDPGPPTFMVDYKVDQFARWAGKTDILGLDHYPCSIKNGCVYTKIDAEAAEADRLGIRYWGVIQAHGDAWYKVPTADELHQQFVHWRATHMEGYLVFAWRFPDNDPSRWLANNLALQAQLALENAY